VVQLGAPRGAKTNSDPREILTSKHVFPGLPPGIWSGGPKSRVFVFLNRKRRNGREKVGVGRLDLETNSPPPKRLTNPLQDRGPRAQGPNNVGNKGPKGVC